MDTADTLPLHLRADIGWTVVAGPNREARSSHLVSHACAAASDFKSQFEERCSWAIEGSSDLKSAMTDVIGNAQAWYADEGVTRGNKSLRFCVSCDPDVIIIEDLTTVWEDARVYALSGHRVIAGFGSDSIEEAISTIKSRIPDWLLDSEKEIVESLFLRPEFMGEKIAVARLVSR